MVKSVSELTQRDVISMHDQVQLLNKIGRQNFMDYQNAQQGELVELKIDGSRVFVRKGTPDLRVAVSCLTGEFEVLRYLLPKDYSGNIIDAGAYIGTATIALRKLFPHAKITAIEPSTDNLQVLRKNLENYKDIDVVHGALVGGSSKKLNLKNRGTGNWGFSVVEAPKDKIDAEKIQEVKTFRISELVKNKENIGLLKMDIEGGEVDVFENDMETLCKIPIVFAELHDRIIDGCSNLFFKFSGNRIVVKDSGEKYLSISRQTVG